MVGRYLPDDCPHCDAVNNTAAHTAGLLGFRDGLHGCLTRWGDALFEATDALLCAPAPVSSVPALSLKPDAVDRPHWIGSIGFMSGVAHVPDAARA